ncbi:hypothetical protein N9Z38_00415 [Mariniblastus sp.]|nr:hypothetical protein [Mariniblastus sp.]
MLTQNCETTSFTREEFYEYVWSAPATKLAAELGCSDVMIGKVCKSHDIPKPYSGYWAQLAHGKQPTPTPLPANNEVQLQTLTFYKYPKVATTFNEPPRESLYDEDITAFLAKARKLGPVSVAKTLRSPHPLISKTKKELERRRAKSRIPWMERPHEDYAERMQILAVEVSDALVSRSLRIMDALIKRVEKVGGNVEVRRCGYNNRDHETVVAIAGERVTRIRLREKHNQVKIVDEKAEYSWERNRTELVPSGLLLFDNGPSSYGSPLLKDSQKFKVEEGLAGFVVQLVRNAGDQRIYRRERQERERQKAIEDEIRREREEMLRQAKQELHDRQVAEQAKVDELVQDARQWQLAKEMREYLQSLSDLPAMALLELDEEISMVNYLKWGFDQADRIDPLVESPGSVLDEKVCEESLFPETIPSASADTITN